MELHVNKQMVSEKIVQLSSSVKRRGLLITKNEKQTEIKPTKLKETKSNCLQQGNKIKLITTSHY